MQYPSRVKLSILEQCHPEFDEVKKTYSDISLVCAGGYQLQKGLSQFIRCRPGESPEDYTTRLSKFTYTPTLPNAVASQVAKVSGGGLQIHGIEGEPFWAYFREHTDIAGQRNEKELLGEILSQVLKYKKTYLQVEKSKSEVQPLNKAQEELLGIKTYVNVHPASQVINWAEDAAGKPTYIKLKQITQDTSDPFQPVRSVVTFTFIDSEYIAKYSAYCTVRDGLIVELLDEVTGKPVNFGSPDVTLALVSPPVKHGFGVIPVIKLELKDEQWLANQALSKALEHLRLSMHKHDLETIAYFQRQWNQIVYPEMDAAATFAQGEKPDTGIQFVPSGNFEWREAQGTILPALQTSLAEIKQEIEDIISGESRTQLKGVVEQSGKSKAYDTQDENELAVVLGSILTACYQDLLQLVAKSQAIPGEAISVTGLNDFSVENADSIISKFQILSQIDMERVKAILPEITLANELEKLGGFLQGNLSAEQAKELKNQVAELIRKPSPFQASSINVPARSTLLVNNAQ